jgi:hypothetical protein
VIGVAIITAVFDSHGSLASSATVIPGFRWALAAAAALSLLGSLAAVGIRQPAARPGRMTQREGAGSREAPAGAAR